MGFEPMMTISKTVALGQTRRFPNKLKFDLQDHQKNDPL